MTFDLAQMIADRDAGTPGDFYVKPLRGYTQDYICTDHPDFQQSPHGNYVGETGLAAGHAKQHFEPDARRFARVPAMEAEIIRLKARLAEYDRVCADLVAHWDSTDWVNKPHTVEKIAAIRAALSTKEEPKT